ncbi:MAG TPA: DnaB-like helicase N-terminal domain-containing protein [Gaiellaceae bacterium]|jgi:replicative DNA helicase|nr:DnaB-like helicase N-terminal domain-containing protein [Gaiellaceae bacterium]
MARRRREPSDPREAKVVPIAGRAPPHDLDAEGAVLGACLLSPDALAIARGILEPKHFYSDPNARIFEAACAVADAGRPVDLVTVAGELRDTNRMAGVGGPSYLAQLVNDSPVSVHLEAHASIVLAKWRARAVIAECQLTAAKSYTGAADLDDLLVAHRALLDQVDAARRSVPSLADRVDRLGTAGAPLSTEIAAIDLALRGGHRRGKVIVLAGAPGAGKTTLAVQIAHDAAMRGIPVSILAADEDAEGLAIRIGQQQGLNRDDLEAGDEFAKATLRERCQTDLASLAMADSDEDGVLLEDVAAELGRRARYVYKDAQGRDVEAQKPALLVLDSIQTIRCQGSDQAETPRAKVDLVMAAIKRCAKIHGVSIIATSEVSRAFYRGGDEREPNALAAGKDSGSIEFGASVVMVLRSVPDGGGDVDVDIVKNRIGTVKTTLRMRIDHARARMSSLETAQSQAPRKGDRQAEAVQRDDLAVERMKAHVVEKLLRSKVPVRTRADLVRMCSGKATVIEKAVTRLLIDQTIVRRPDAAQKNRHVLVVAGASDEAPLPIASRSLPDHFPDGGASGETASPKPSPPAAKLRGEATGSAVEHCEPHGSNGTQSDRSLPDRFPLPGSLPDDEAGAS